MGRGERGRGGGPESQVAVEVEQAPPGTTEEGRSQRLAAGGAMAAGPLQA